jgi:regulatory protein
LNLTEPDSAEEARENNSAEEARESQRAEKTREHSAEAARKKALALLARREHSGAELRVKLNAAGFSAGIVGGTLSVLAQEGWLSDARFTEAFVRARRERGYGPVRIRAELRERGVDEELIDRHLDMHDPAWLRPLEQVWTKRFRARRGADFAERARQQRFFQARGYTVEQIRAVIGRGDGR